MALADVAAQLDLTHRNRHKRSPAHAHPRGPFARLGRVHTPTALTEASMQTAAELAADSNITDLILSSYAEDPQAPVYAAVSYTHLTLPTKRIV